MQWTWADCPFHEHMGDRLNRPMRNDERIGLGAPVLRFAGLRIMPLTTSQAVDALAGRPANAPFSAFVTPNVEHAFLRLGDERFRRAGDRCFLSTNDSRVLRRAGRLAGLELQFAPGAYVVKELFERAISPQTKLSIIGGAPGLAMVLMKRFGLKSVVQHIPPMGFIHDEAAVKAAVEFVATHPAQYVFVAMGPPQSELFCERVIEDGRSSGLGLCIGSSLQVLTGSSSPAPDWMENAGLVWLYRLVREPKRLWRRYIVRGGVGLALCLRDVVAIRLGLYRPVLNE